MTVQARDRTIEHDGALHDRTASQITSDLWSAWSANNTLTLRDIDYDQDPTERTALLIGISESRTGSSPGLSSDASTIALTLVEV